MAKQTSSTKAVGTVDELNFYEEKGEYRVRRKTGVTAERVKNDDAFANSRASSGRFGWGNTLYSLVYRYVLPCYKSNTLSSLCMKKSVTLVNQYFSDEEVLRGLYSFLETLHCLAISAEDFEANIPALLREADARARNPKPRRKRKKKEKITFIISEPLAEEDKELFINESDDFDWQVVFAGEFPKDYEIPICFTGRIVDEFRGLRTVLRRPREEIMDDWVAME
ncbi:MAG TPA: hypothetical protein VJ499_08945 [Flavisolibacter sp.]|nr:hypothetical protein [Flavisolibacter sp.]